MVIWISVMWTIVMVSWWEKDLVSKDHSDVRRKRHEEIILSRGGRSWLDYLTGLFDWARYYLTGRGTIWLGYLTGLTFVSPTIHEWANNWLHWTKNTIMWNTQWHNTYTTKGKKKRDKDKEDKESMWVRFDETFWHDAVIMEDWARCGAARFDWARSYLTGRGVIRLRDLTGKFDWKYVYVPLMWISII